MGFIKLTSIDDSAYLVDKAKIVAFGKVPKNSNDYSSVKLIGGHEIIVKETLTELLEKINPEVDFDMDESWE